MANYSPSASDFEKWDEEFTPSAEHFSQWDKEDSSNEPEIDLEMLKKKHPIIYSLAEKLQKHPKIASAIQGIADSPGVQGALSAGPALVNAFGNMANLPSEVFAGKQIFPTMERPEEPKDLAGKIGSKIGEGIGAATAFAAVPGSMTIPGGLATGFAQGAGGILNRGMDALIGMLLPSALHGIKAGKSFLNTRNVSKEIQGLQHEKAQAEKGVYGAKEELANKLSGELAPTQEGKESLTESIKNIAGKSESESKQNVANLTQQAEKDIVKKYKGLYEGFNQGKGGQSLVKDPIQIQSLEKEYGLKSDDFSTDSKKLIQKLIGKNVEEPGGKIVSATTGKPLNEASISLKQAKPAKVSDYINLWKQLRAEVAEYRHSGKMAQTPAAKRAFREKANQLEKLSDDINSRAMGSLSKVEEKQYSEIQKGYLNERVPFLEKPILKNATDKFGEVPDNFFEKLNKSGVPELLKTFKKEHPELVKAITKHDIRDLSKLGTTQLKELISGDFGRFIPKEVKNLLTGLHEKKSAEDLLKNALGKVQATEIGRKVKSSDINAIIKQRPDLAKPFKTIEAEQARVRKIKNALVDAGFKLKEAEASLKKYKTATSAIKGAGLPVGAYMGIVKSKGTSSGEGD